MAGLVETLKGMKFSKTFLNAFAGNTTELAAFSTSFNSDAAVRGNKIRVPFYGLGTVKDWDRDTGYEFDDMNVDAPEITLDQRSYLPIALSSEDLQNMPEVDISKAATGYGAQLANSFTRNVLSAVNKANFANVMTGITEATFDYDSLIDIKTKCDTLETMPNAGRFLVLRYEAYNALLRDRTIVNNGVPRTWQNIIDGKVEPIAGFTVLPSLSLPAGVTGFACMADALLVGSRVIKPDANDIEFEQFNDPASGLTIAYKRAYNFQMDQGQYIWESSYGKQVGDSSKAVRLISAATDA